VSAHLPEIALTMTRLHAPKPATPLAAMLLWFATACGAAELNVSLTHVPLTQEQARQVVNKALPPEFDRSFNPKAYAVHVLADRHQATDGREAVYVLMGLQRRLPDGRALQEHTYLSSMQFLNPGLTDADRRGIVEAVLTKTARGFAKSMMDNAARVR
jgi:hypothetical protein